MVKVRSIDDVPMLALTLWSDQYDHYHLRQIAAEVDDIPVAVLPVVEQFEIVDDFLESGDLSHLAAAPPFWRTT
jgi:hypothetical protein